MDELAETELFDATCGLGNWHSVPNADGTEKRIYLMNRDECLACLKDIQIALKVPEGGCSTMAQMVHLKLGEWKTLPNHLVPLFSAYRADEEISRLVLAVLVKLTSRADLGASDLFQHLHYLQNYKEAFAKKDIFIILMTMLVGALDEDEEAEGEEGAQPAGGSAVDKKVVFQSVLGLLCNLVSVPDPLPGDAGFTMTRRNLQITYITNFHEEGVFDFLLLFAETAGSEDEGKQAWRLLEILYHLCATLNPEELGAVEGRKEKEKGVLSSLLAKDAAHARLCAPQSSRHARFGTAIQKRDGMGGSTVSGTLTQVGGVSKGKRLYGREYNDKRQASEKKQNMFHNPFFIDLEGGSVRDHNQLNPHVQTSMNSSLDLSRDVLQGLKKFFEEFVQTSFSSFVNGLRSSLPIAKPGQPLEKGREYDWPRLLNFLTWMLEFHRHIVAAKASEAKKAKQPSPGMDIACVQGALDLDMLQFVTARLREYGKNSNIHASYLVISLRALAQQLRTISVALEAKDSETKDVGEILVQNIVKDDVMAHLAWIMKNYKSSSHDPRILSYTVEVFHNLLKAMTKVSQKEGGVEFTTESANGSKTKRGATTAEAEIEKLADARVVDNLFHLLEKYNRHTPQLHSMLVKLIYQIIKAKPTNIVVFFELSYFIRILRIASDPIVKDRIQGKPYVEMTQLLQFIIRQFFKCAEKNKCVFVEVLFRKVHENPKEALLESNTSEWAAILDNYEDESYKTVLDRMQAGETIDAMRKRQKAMLDGYLPWSEAEDEILRTKHPLYADHPLCADLLAAELPEENRRTGRQVKKRLFELEIVRKKGEAGADDRNMPAEKRQKLDEDMFKDVFTDDLPAAAEEVDNQEGDDDMFKDIFGQEGEGSLDMDLERLLDEAMEGGEDIFGVGEKTGCTATVPESNLEMDLELELEKMMEAGAGHCTATAMEATATAMDATATAMEATVGVGATAWDATATAAEGAPADDDMCPTATATECTATAAELGTSAGPAMNGADLELELEKMMEAGAAFTTDTAPHAATAPDLEVPPVPETALDGVCATALEESMSQGMSLSQVGAVDASQAAWLEGELASVFAGGEPDGGAVASSQLEATQRSQSQPVASPDRARSQDDLEGELERIMEAGLSQNFVDQTRAAAEAMSPTAPDASQQSLPGSLGAAAEAMSQTAPDASQQSLPGSLEAALEGIMDAGLSQSWSQP